MAMVDGAWSWDGEGGMGMTMNQDWICKRAVFSVWSERAVERQQGERFEWARRMGQIFVAMLAGVCSREAGQLRLWSDWNIWVTRWQKGGVVLEWMMIVLYDSNGFSFTISKRSFRTIEYQTKTSPTWHIRLKKVLHLFPGNSNNLFSIPEAFLQADTFQSCLHLIVRPY